MKVFIFDTETTGFPIKGAPIEQQPFVVQFAGILLYIDSFGKGEEIDRVNILIRPGISIPFATSQVHGIYDKDVTDKQMFIYHADTILSYLNTADVVVGHNIEFDEEVIRHEFHRCGRSGFYHPKQTICTMRTSTDYCALQGRGFSYKPPKLNELYLKLFGERFSTRDNHIAHDALIDVEATLACLRRLIDLGVVTLKETKEMRLF